MRIARSLSPVHSLGPGERVCLWTQGCKKGCPGCISPEMQPPTGPELPVPLLSQLLVDTAKRGNCQGLTISGGDPLEQPEELLALLKLLRPHFSDILVYTGYRLEELQAGIAGEAGRACLSYIDVLIDGPYCQALNTPDCVLRGSSNQQIHFLRRELEASYRAYMAQGRQLESFVHGDTVIVTGIFNKEESK